MSHEKQKEIFSRLVKGRALEFSDIKDKVDRKNLVYIFKTGEKGFKTQKILEIIKCHWNYLKN